MSFHVLHVLTHGAVLSKERGRLCCKGPEGSLRTLPHQDIRAVIIAAQGVTLTSRFLSAILESEGIILHCTPTYRPCGITAPLPRIIDPLVFESQISRPKALNAKLWHGLLTAKTRNQIAVLKSLQLCSPHLEQSLKGRAIDEANNARRYWKLYFPALGWEDLRRHQETEAAPNQMLNYGYAVIASLCHRSLLIHGLLPSLGVKHLFRYRSTPLVFDLMEAFRPFVDYQLAQFLRTNSGGFNEWAKAIGTSLREHRVTHPRYSLKLMDAIDTVATTFARAYRDKSATPLWLPQL